MKSQRFERVIELPAKPEIVWPLLAQTDRLNREMDLPLPQFAYVPRKNGGTDACAVIKFAGILFRYDEHPFEWVRPRYYSVKRTFDAGPVSEVIGRVNFEAKGGSTIIHVISDVKSRTMPWLANMLAKRSFDQLDRTCRGFDSFMTKRSQTPYPNECARPPADEDRLRKGKSEMVAAGVEPYVSQYICDFLLTSPAADLVNFRPLELALHRSMSPDKILEACLVATRLGLMDMRWRVMCPYCKSNKDTAKSLANVRLESHCEACNIRFDSSFDENVEVVFSVSHLVRPVVYGSYCIGGPELSPQAIAQWILEPGETRKAKISLLPKIWQICSLQAFDRPAIIVRKSGASECHVTIKEAAIELDREIWSDKVELTIENLTEARVILRLEEGDWRSNAVTAAQVTSLQSFRDQFSSEVLSPGTEISINQICIMFTDLKGSTQMYREMGDAPSYAAVRTHFERLRACIAKHNGAVVKTIGDAIMATFHDPANGVRAAIEIQQSNDPMVTKIGLHRGPAIVVNANDNLDYFGRTVNLASRLQKQSQGGDVVLAADFADEQGIRTAIEEMGAQVTEFVAEIPDIEREMRLVRLWPAVPRY